MLVLVDYPGFNLRIAKWAKQQGLKWFIIFRRKFGPEGKQGKRHKRKRGQNAGDPSFEKKIFIKMELRSGICGHPLVEVIDNFQLTTNQPTTNKKHNCTVARQPQTGDIKNCP